MPELPDVELFTRYFRKTSLHKNVSSVEVCREKILRNVSRAALGKTLEGTSFTGAVRHGKYLFARTKRGPWLVLHFGMTGSLKYFKGAPEVSPYFRLLLRFAGKGALAFEDQRIFGSVRLVRSPEELLQDKELGPDALSLGFPEFARLLSTSRSVIKADLMDQTKIAGIGNIYSDEILFQSGIHPGAKSGKLPERKARELYRNMRKVLLMAIQRHADPARLPFNTYMLPRREKQGECPRSCGVFSHKTIAGRTAYFCPVCQKRSF
jgi:formamidopyrimidine-DNA glycosylase